MRRLLVALSLWGVLGLPVVGAEIDLKSLQPLEAKKSRYGPYVGVFAGNTSDQNADMELDYVGHSLSYDVLDRSSDLIAGIEVGYSWRTRFPVEVGLEFEALYGSTEINAIFSDKRNAGTPIDLGDVVTAQTDMSYVAFMLNGTLTLDLRKYRPRIGRFLPRFRPYVGGGVGGAQVWFRNQRTQSVGDLLGFPTASAASPFGIDEFVAAYQMFTGLEFMVTEKLGVYGEFRRLSFSKTNDLTHFHTDMLIGGLHLRY